MTERATQTGRYRRGDPGGALARLPAAARRHRGGAHHRRGHPRPRPVAGAPRERRRGRSTADAVLSFFSQQRVAEPDRDAGAGRPRGRPRIIRHLPVSRRRWSGGAGATGRQKSRASEIEELAEGVGRDARTSTEVAGGPRRMRSRERRGGRLRRRDHGRPSRRSCDRWRLGAGGPCADRVRRSRRRRRCEAMLEGGLPRARSSSRWASSRPSRTPSVRRW